MAPLAPIAASVPEFLIVVMPLALMNGNGANAPMEPLTPINSIAPTFSVIRMESTPSDANGTTREK